MHLGCAWRPPPSQALPTTETRHAPTLPLTSRATARGRVRVPRAGRRRAGRPALQRPPTPRATHTGLRLDVALDVQDTLVQASGLGRGDDRPRGRQPAADVHRVAGLPEHVVLPPGSGGRRSPRDRRLDRLRAVPARRERAQYEKNEEVGCGLANDVKQGARRMRPRMSRPGCGRQGGCRYLVRVAEVANNSPSGGLPTLTVKFAARDVTAPHIFVTLSAEEQPRVRRRPTTGKRDHGMGVRRAWDPATATGVPR